MTIRKKEVHQKHDEKFSMIGSIEDVTRVSVSPEQSLQIRKVIIETKKREFGFDLSSPSQKTTFIWLEQNIPEYKREEIVSALIDMKGVKILDSMSGTIEIPKPYFE